MSSWSVKTDALRPGIVGMRGSMVVRLRPCMTRVHPSPTLFVLSVVPRGMEGRIGCFHLGRKPHVPRMLHAAPLYQDRLRDGQFCRDGGSEHPPSAATSRLALGREIWTGEITFPLPLTLLLRHAVTLITELRGMIALIDFIEPRRVVRAY